MKGWYTSVMLMSPRLKNKYGKNDETTEWSILFFNYAFFVDSAPKGVGINQIRPVWKKNATYAWILLRFVLTYD